MAKTVTCTALAEFTRFVEGYGQVVGSPDSSLAEAKKPEVPEHVVSEFVRDGLVRAPTAWIKAQEAAAAEEAEAAAAAEAAAGSEGSADGAGEGAGAATDQAPA